jgi:hypothetical protein
MRSHHDQTAHIAVRDVHSTDLSFESVSRDQYDHSEKIEQERLYDFEGVSPHSLTEHCEQNHKVDHEQEDSMTDEDASITSRLAHEMSSK